MSNCPHCGLIHQTTCPRIKAIEYNTDGSWKRVEFHEPKPTFGVVCGDPMHPVKWQPRTILDGPANCFAGRYGEGQDCECDNPAVEGCPRHPNKWRT